MLPHQRGKCTPSYLFTTNTSQETLAAFYHMYGSPSLPHRLGHQSTSEGYKRELQNLLGGSMVSGLCLVDLSLKLSSGRFIPGIENPHPSQPTVFLRSHEVPQVCEVVVNDRSVYTPLIAVHFWLKPLIPYDYEVELVNGMILFLEKNCLNRGFTCKLPGKITAISRTAWARWRCPEHPTLQVQPSAASPHPHLEDAVFLRLGSPSASEMMTRPRRTARGPFSAE